MSATTGSLYGLVVIAQFSATLVRLSGAANLMDARVGHLLAQWSVSSPHCKARREQATVEGGHKVFRAAEDAAIREYAEFLIIPLHAVELVVALKAPKTGFCALSEFFTRQGLQYSLKTGRVFPPSTALIERMLRTLRDRDVSFQNQNVIGCFVPRVAC